MTTIDQPSSAPTPKVAAGGAAGAAAAVISWLLQVTLSVDMPPGIEAAVAVLVATAVSYFVRDRAVVHEGPS